MSTDGNWFQRMLERMRRERDDPPGQQGQGDPVARATEPQPGDRGEGESLYIGRGEAGGTSLGDIGAPILTAGVSYALESTEGYWWLLDKMAAGKAMLGDIVDTVTRAYIEGRAAGADPQQQQMDWLMAEGVEGASKLFRESELGQALAQEGTTITLYTEDGKEEVLSVSDVINVFLFWIPAVGLAARGGRAAIKGLGGLRKPIDGPPRPGGPGGGPRGGPEGPYDELPPLIGKDKIVIDSAADGGSQITIGARTLQKEWQVVEGTQLPLTPGAQAARAQNRTFMALEDVAEGRVGGTATATAVAPSAVAPSVVAPRLPLPPGAQAAARMPGAVEAAGAAAAGRGVQIPIGIPPIDGPPRPGVLPPTPMVPGPAQPMPGDPSSDTRGVPYDPIPQVTQIPQMPTVPQMPVPGAEGMPGMPVPVPGAEGMPVPVPGAEGMPQPTLPQALPTPTDVPQVPGVVVPTPTDVPAEVAIGEPGVETVVEPQPEIIEDPLPPSILQPALENFPIGAQLPAPQLPNSQAVDPVTGAPEPHFVTSTVPGGEIMPGFDLGPVTIARPIPDGKTNATSRPKTVIVIEGAPDEVESQIQTFLQENPGMSVADREVLTEPLPEAVAVQTQLRQSGQMVGEEATFVSGGASAVTRVTLGVMPVTGETDRPVYIDAQNPLRYTYRPDSRGEDPMAEQFLTPSEANRLSNAARSRAVILRNRHPEQADRLNRFADAMSPHTNHNEVLRGLDRATNGTDMWPSQILEEAGFDSIRMEDVANGQVSWASFDSANVHSAVPEGEADLLLRAMDWIHAKYETRLYGATTAGNSVEASERELQSFEPQVDTDLLTDPRIKPVHDFYQQAMGGYSLREPSNVVPEMAMFGKVLTDDPGALPILEKFRMNRVADMRDHLTVEALIRASGLHDTRWSAAIEAIELGKPGVDTTIRVAMAAYNAGYDGIKWIRPGAGEISDWLVLRPGRRSPLDDSMKVGRTQIQAVRKIGRDVLNRAYQRSGNLFARAAESAFFDPQYLNNLRGDADEVRDRTILRSDRPTVGDARFYANTAGQVRVVEARQRMYEDVGPLAPERVEEEVFEVDEPFIPTFRNMEWWFDGTRWHAPDSVGPDGRVLPGEILNAGEVPPEGAVLAGLVGQRIPRRGGIRGRDRETVLFEEALRMADALFESFVTEAYPYLQEHSLDARSFLEAMYELYDTLSNPDLRAGFMQTAGERLEEVVADADRAQVGASEAADYIGYMETEYAFHVANNEGVVSPKIIKDLAPILATAKNAFRRNDYTMVSDLAHHAEQTVVSYDKEHGRDRPESSKATDLLIEQLGARVVALREAWGSKPFPPVIVRYNLEQQPREAQEDPGKYYDWETGVEKLRAAQGPRPTPEPVPERAAMTGEELKALSPPGAGESMTDADWEEYAKQKEARRGARERHVSAFGTYTGAPRLKKDVLLATARGEAIYKAERHGPKPGEAEVESEGEGKELMEVERSGPYPVYDYNVLGRLEEEIRETVRRLTADARFKGVEVEDIASAGKFDDPLYRGVNDLDVGRFIDDDGNLVLRQRRGTARGISTTTSIERATAYATNRELATRFFREEEAPIPGTVFEIDRSALTEAQLALMVEIQQPSALRESEARAGRDLGSEFEFGQEPDVWLEDPDDVTGHYESGEPIFGSYQKPAELVVPRGAYRILQEPAAEVPGALERKQNEAIVLKGKVEYFQNQLEDHKRLLPVSKPRRRPDLLEEERSVEPYVEGSGIPDVVYHGTPGLELGSFLDEEGNLILRSAENFEGRQVAVSFSPFLDEAESYGGRVEGDPEASRPYTVFKIEAASLPEGLRWQTEADIYGATPLDVEPLFDDDARTGHLIVSRAHEDVVIPAGSFTVLQPDQPTKMRPNLEYLPDLEIRLTDRGIEQVRRARRETPYREGAVRDPRLQFDPKESDRISLEAEVYIHKARRLYLGDGIQGGYSPSQIAQRMEPLQRLWSVAANPDLDQWMRYEALSHLGDEVEGLRQSVTEGSADLSRVEQEMDLRGEEMSLPRQGLAGVTRRDPDTFVLPGDPFEGEATTIEEMMNDPYLYMYVNRVGPRAIWMRQEAHDQKSALEAEGGGGATRGTDPDRRHEVLWVISGVQTGVDQWGLEIAKELGIRTGGTMPKGRIRSQTGERDKGAPKIDDELLRTLGELGDFDEDLTVLGPSWRDAYESRTGINAARAEGTLWWGNEGTPGYQLTSRLAREANRAFIANPGDEDFRRWLADNNVQTLNVAGNRIDASEDAAKEQELKRAGLRRLLRNTIVPVGAGPELSAEVLAREGLSRSREGPSIRGEFEASFGSFPTVMAARRSLTPGRQSLVRLREMREEALQANDGPGALLILDEITHRETGEYPRDVQLLRELKGEQEDRMASEFGQQMSEDEPLLPKGADPAAGMLGEVTMPMGEGEQTELEDREKLPTRESLEEVEGFQVLEYDREGYSAVFLSPTGKVYSTPGSAKHNRIPEKIPGWEHLSMLGAVAAWSSLDFVHAVVMPPATYAGQTAPGAIGIRIRADIDLWEAGSLAQKVQRVVDTLTEVFENTHPDINLDDVDWVVTISEGALVANPDFEDEEGKRRQDILGWPHLLDSTLGTRGKFATPTGEAIPYARLAEGRITNKQAHGTGASILRLIGYDEGEAAFKQARDKITKEEADLDAYEAEFGETEGRAQRNPPAALPSGMTEGEGLSEEWQPGTKATPLDRWSVEDRSSIAQRRLAELREKAADAGGRNNPEGTGPALTQAEIGEEAEIVAWMRAGERLREGEGPPETGMIDTEEAPPPEEPSPN